MAVDPITRADRRVPLGNPEEVDNRRDGGVARLAAQEWGVVSAAELHSLGIADDGIHRRVQAGRLHRIHRGVYAVGHPKVTLQGEFLAAVKACRPGTALAGFAAAANYGFLTWEDRDIEVLVPGTSTAVHAGIEAHRASFLDPRDVRRHHGIPTTSPALTLLHLAGRMDQEALRSAVRRAQGMRLVNVREILETMARLGPRPGARKLRAIVATGPAPTRSVLEDIVLDLILRAGFEHPDVNVALRIRGRRVVPDFRWAKQRLILEADGDQWHRGEVARRQDAERQARLEQDGERVMRVTWEEAIRRPAQTIRRLELAGVPRSQGRSSSSSGKPRGTRQPAR